MAESLSAILIGVFVILATLANDGGSRTRKVAQMIVNILFFALLIPFVYYMAELIEAFNRVR